jgi:RecB family endonuclease NucS
MNGFAKQIKPSKSEVQIAPSLEDAEAVLNAALRSRRFVIVIGDCKVDYDGRASSTLDWGVRVTMIKQDGSVLVHRPVGYEPVNWQPPTCLVRAVLLEKGVLQLVASRPKPRETVSVEFRSIDLTVVGNFSDRGQFSLHVTEEQMKQALLISPQLVEVGLKPLEEEKSLGDAGFTDIFAEDKDGKLVVVEIKRNAASKDAVLQLQRYLDTLRETVNKPLRGIVAAPDLRRNAGPLLSSLGLEFVKVDPEKCFIVLKTRKDMKLSHFIH